VDRRELEERSGLDARTIRFLIAQKIIPEPNGSGRGASYDTSHLQALANYRALKDEGLKLDAIRRRVVDGNKITNVLEIVPGLEMHFSTTSQKYQQFMLDPHVLNALETLKLAAERNS
jgi:DNA-binding transcriptional MerR regulator